MTERLLTTADVAERLSMSEDWVRDHAAELGAIKMGAGKRAPLRFEPQALQRAIEDRRLLTPRRARRPRPGSSRRSTRDVKLVPLPDEGLL